MSSDLSAIHAQTSAILEKLYEERGQPDELDESFVEEYFKLVNDELNLGDDEDEVDALGPRKTEAKLSQQRKGLTEVYIPSKHEKFLVNRHKAVKTLHGTSQRIGKDRGKGTYILTDVRGIPNITIKTGRAVVVFIGTPYKVSIEHGKGEWVKA